MVRPGPELGLGYQLPYLSCTQPSLVPALTPSSLARTLSSVPPARLWQEACGEAG
jgi:hypothetical protein